MEKEFNISEWEFERSSGYAGYRNTKTEEWIYEIEYNRRLNVFIEENNVLVDKKGIIFNLSSNPINHKNAEKLYWFNQFQPLFHDVMNLGMGLRQDQLNGSCDKSGNEILKDWVDKQILELK